MAEIKSKEDRSRNMSAIKNKDTKPEIIIRSKLFSLGYRYRKNVRQMPGHPDIWLKKYNTVIFINGCFWHRHSNCKYAYTPKSKVEFWNNKFEANIKRDNTVKEEYSKMGIRLLVVWECSIKNDKKNEYINVLNQIAEFLDKEEAYKEI